MEIEKTTMECYFNISYKLTLKCLIIHFGENYIKIYTCHSSRQVYSVYNNKDRNKYTTKCYLI